MNVRFTAELERSDRDDAAEQDNDRQVDEPVAQQRRLRLRDALRRLRPTRRRQLLSVELHGRSLGGVAVPSLRCPIRMTLAESRCPCRTLSSLMTRSSHSASTAVSFCTCG